MFIKEELDANTFFDRHKDQWLESEASCAPLYKAVKNHNPESRFFFVEGSTDQNHMTACLSSSDQVLLSTLSENQAEEFARYFFEQGIEVPGLFAPSPISFSFANLYSKLTNKESNHVKQLAHYELSNLSEFSLSNGHLEKASREDIDIYIRYRRLNQIEDNIQRPSDPEEEILKELESDSLYVWKDTQSNIVTIGTLFCNRSPRSSYIYGIYTPKEFRGQGFATSLVYRMCEISRERNLIPSLAVNIENERAIQIYERLGFNRICLMDNIRFN